MHPTPIRLTADDIAAARLIISNPDSFNDDPDSRLDAWTALKALRGQSVNKLLLQRLQRRYSQPVNIPVRRDPVPEARFYDGMAS